VLAFNRGLAAQYGVPTSTSMPSPGMVQTKFFAAMARNARIKCSMHGQHGSVKEEPDHDDIANAVAF